MTRILPLLLPRVLVLIAALLAAPAAARPETALTQTFSEEGFGYTLRYPEDWSRSAPDAFTIVLRPPPETAAGPVSVSIQNVRRPENAHAGDGPAQLAERYVREMKAQARGVTVHRQAPFRWDAGTAVLMGRQVVADFTRDGLPFRQWAIFLPNPAAPVVHVWLYTAPQSLFNQWLETADRILQSLEAAPPKPGERR